MPLTPDACSVAFVTSLQRKCIVKMCREQVAGSASHGAGLRLPGPAVPMATRLCTRSLCSHWDHLHSGSFRSFLVGPGGEAFAVSHHSACGSWLLPWDSHGAVRPPATCCPWKDVCEAFAALTVHTASALFAFCQNLCHHLLLCSQSSDKM